METNVFTEDLLKDKRILSNIVFFANRLHRTYRYSMSFEDAKQILILQLIKKLPKAKTDNIYWNARSILLSYTGSLIQDKGNKSRKIHNMYISIDSPCIEKYTHLESFEFSIIAKVMLDCIEVYIRKWTKDSKQMYYAYRVFKMLRQGYSFRDISKNLKINEPYARKVLSCAIKKLKRESVPLGTLEI